VHELCFECQVIMLPRSYHCNVCHRCVERYDHHCPWINSCIGTRNHAWFLVFITFQTIYILAILTQIVAFFVTFERSALEEATGVHEVVHFLRNTCVSLETMHAFDLCTPAMLSGGFFASSEHLESHVVVIFAMTMLLLLAAPFTFGLVTLWLVQMRNFCAGMTTLERYGSVQQRHRNYSYVQQIRDANET